MFSIFFMNNVIVEERSMTRASLRKIGRVCRRGGSIGEGRSMTPNPNPKYGRRICGMNTDVALKNVLPNDEIVNPLVVSQNTEHLPYMIFEDIYLHIHN